MAILKLVVSIMSALGIISFNIQILFWVLHDIRTHPFIQLPVF